MKGVSLAIETVVYMILAVLVLSVTIAYFLSVGTPPLQDIELIAKQQRYCGMYVYSDPRCAGLDGSPVPSASLATKFIGTTCSELNRRGYSYEKCSSATSLECIRQCCTIECGTSP